MTQQHLWLASLLGPFAWDLILWKVGIPPKLTDSLWIAKQFGRTKPSLFPGPFEFTRFMGPASLVSSGLPCEPRPALVAQAGIVSQAGLVSPGSIVPYKTSENVHQIYGPENILRTPYLITVL